MDDRQGELKSLLGEAEKAASEVGRELIREGPHLRELFNLLSQHGRKIGVGATLVGGGSYGIAAAAHHCANLLNCH